MIKNKSNSTEGDIIVNKDILINWLISGILIIAIIFIGALFIKGISYEKSYNQEKSNAQGSYFDKNLNVIVNYPYEWFLSEIDLTETELVTRESASGSIFNLGKHSLNKEVVSLMLVSEPTDTGGFCRFMTLSFMGDNFKRGGDLQENLEEKLKREIESTGVGDVEVIQNLLLSDDSVFIEVSSKVDGVPIYYYQYSSVVGNNIGTVLMGSRTKEMDALSQVKGVITGLIIQDVLGNPSSVIPSNGPDTNDIDSLESTTTEESSFGTVESEDIESER